MVSNRVHLLVHLPPPTRPAPVLTPRRRPPPIRHPLATKLAGLGAIHRAHQTFSSLPRHDLFLYNVLIRGFSRNGSPSSAVSLYLRLSCATSLRPENFTYAFAISTDLLRRCCPSRLLLVRLSHRSTPLKKKDI